MRYSIASLVVALAGSAYGQASTAVVDEDFLYSTNGDSERVTGLTFLAEDLLFQSNDLSDDSEIVASLTETNFQGFAGVHGLGAKNHFLFVAEADGSLSDGTAITGDTVVYEYNAGAVSVFEDLSDNVDGSFSVDALSYDAGGDRLFISFSSTETFGTNGLSLENGGVGWLQRSTGMAFEFFSETFIEGGANTGVNIDAFHWENDDNFFISGSTDDEEYIDAGGSGGTSFFEDAVVIEYNVVGDDFFASAYVSAFTGSTDPITLMTSAEFGEDIEAFSFIPAPGALAVLGMGGLVAARRRR